MSTQKQTEKKHVFNGVLAALLTAVIVSATALTGCGSGKSDDKPQVSVVTETQNVTTVLNDILLDDNGNPVTDPSGNPVHATTAPATAAAQATTKADAKQQATAAATNLPSPPPRRTPPPRS